MKKFLLITFSIAQMGFMYSKPERVTCNIKKSGLVDVNKVNPKILVELVYATKDNFTGQLIYPKTAKCYLLPEVAEKINLVQRDLEKIGLGLVITDGYRPPSAQQKLWDVCPDPRYVAPPQKGGRHTRGTTVDLTLVDLKTGKRLEMPSEVDDLTEKAWRSYDKCSEVAKKNRALLQEVMEKQGFIGLPTEWWHFDYIGWQNYPPLNVDFEVLA